MLFPALERLLEMLEALKSYFNSQKRYPTIIRQCYENPAQELYLRFVHGQLKYFDETMLKLERQKTSAVDVAIIFTELRLITFTKRKVVPCQAKRLLEKLEKWMQGYFSSKLDIFTRNVNHIWMFIAMSRKM